MFPRGNRDGNGAQISLYLNVADYESAPLGWSRTAKFTLSVVDQKEPERSATKGGCMPSQLPSPVALTDCMSSILVIEVLMCTLAMAVPGSCEHL